MMDVSEFAIFLEFAVGFVVGGVIFYVLGAVCIWSASRGR